jgi:hypothetical protein
MSQPRRHHRFKVLAAGMLAICLIPACFALSIADPVRLASAYFGWAVAVYLLAAGGTMVAALTFEPGEPLRPAWSMVSASYLVLVPVLLRIGPKASGLFDEAVPYPVLDSFASISNGILGVFGFLLLARAWRASGLDTTSAAGRLSAQLVALLVAGAMAGPELIVKLPAALAGDASAAGDVVADLLDGALFVVAVPVLRAALVLGGGLVAWPWLLLTASLVAWLGYDATAVYGGAAGLDARSVRVVEEIWRSLGAAFAFAAGIAQRWVMTEAE